MNIPSYFLPFQGSAYSKIFPMKRSKRESTFKYITNINKQLQLCTTYTNITKSFREILCKALNEAKTDIIEMESPESVSGEMHRGIPSG